MVSDLLWLLALLGALFWVVLPATVLVLAAFYKGKDPAEAAAQEDAAPPG
ncbi:MAG: hypothetical protein ACRDZ7_17910 [Acidimicrobiia bacterium]